MAINEMEQDIDRVFFTEEQIQTKIAELAETLNEEYAGKFPVFLGILKGVYPFYADLMRRLTIHVQTDFIAASSYYGGCVSTGKLTIKKDTDVDLKGRHVVIVEDIVDSGNTLYLLKQHLADRGAASIKLITLLDKPARRERDIVPDHYCFRCENEFVVGYGLDYDEKYRNLPYIGILKKEVYGK